MNFVIIPKEHIRLAPDGFSLCKGEEEIFSVRWRDVREVVAFKRDLLTSDSICLAFRVGDRNLFFEVNEEIEGFILLSDEMMRQLPSTSGDWLTAVTQPPFAENRTRIFGEPHEVG